MIYLALRLFCLLFFLEPFILFAAMIGCQVSAKRTAQVFVWLLKQQDSGIVSVVIHYKGDVEAFLGDVCGSEFLTTQYSKDFCAELERHQELFESS